LYRKRRRQQIKVREGLEKKLPIKEIQVTKEKYNEG
jgi:hypothetical protein